MCPFPRRAFTVALAALLALAGLAALFLAPPSPPVLSDPGPDLGSELHELHKEHARKVEAFLASSWDLPGEEVREALEALHRDLQKKLRELHRKHGLPWPDD